jgi:hypothetical protein
LLRKLFKREKGNATLLVSLSLTALLAATGIVIDGGKLYMTKSHLQKVANAAALSGVQELLTSNDKARNVVHEVLDYHDESTNLQSLVISDSKITVTVAKDVPLSFSRLLGKENAEIKASASAQIGTMGSAVGAVPLGIDRSFDLQYYQEYQLRTDQLGSDTGWFGILALGGPGAATYYENFKNGYQHEIKINDVIETQTGNVAGKTRTAVKERINNCPYPIDEAIEKNCSRIILVPVYEPYQVDSNQVKQVKITGFAYFYLTRPSNDKNTAVYGMFIKEDGTGFINENADNRGAFSIRLTE